MAHFICEKLQELEEVCKSDELTLDKLREKIEGFPPPLCPKPYLPLLCENKNVTLEIVEYMLNTFPGVAGTKKYCPYSGEPYFQFIWHAIMRIVRVQLFNCWQRVALSP